MGWVCPGINPSERELRTCGGDDGRFSLSKVFSKRR
jgi:hypothetical protein